jgi:hypothetical protein
MSETVKKAMTIFLEEYGEKFRVTESKIKFWGHSLQEFDSSVILAAAYHLATINKWPPVIAEMREACVDMAYGELVTVPAPEAWHNVQKFLHDEGQLSDIERIAMRHVGDSWYFKRSDTPGMDRAHFMKAYSAQVDKQKRERLTLPNVMRFANENAKKLLPEPNATDEYMAPEPESQSPESQKMDRDELNELLSNFERRYMRVVGRADAMGQEKETAINDGVSYGETLRMKLQITELRKQVLELSDVVVYQAVRIARQHKKDRL